MTTPNAPSDGLVERLRHYAGDLPEQIHDDLRAAADALTDCRAYVTALRLRVAELERERDEWRGKYNTKIWHDR